MLVNGDGFGSRRLHILLQRDGVGSEEQARYAIQDTPEMVLNHCGRFLPQDKAVLAARILNPSSKQNTTGQLRSHLQLDAKVDGWLRRESPSAGTHGKAGRWKRLVCALTPMQRSRCRYP